MNWISPLIEEYHQFLIKKTRVQELTDTGWMEISTPHVGLFNDSIVLYAKKIDNGKIFIGDDGDTLRNLELEGVTVKETNSPRGVILSRILTTFGVSKLNNGELYVETSIKDFAKSKYNLISAIQQVNDMSVLSRPFVKNMFIDDVKDFLDKSEYIINPNFMLRGKSGLSHTFSFQIAYKKSEVFIQAFPSLNKTTAVPFLYKVHDTKELRAFDTTRKYKAVALVDDRETSVSRELISVLERSDVNVLNWSNRYSLEFRSTLSE